RKAARSAAVPPATPAANREPPLLRAGCVHQARDARLRSAASARPANHCGKAKRRARFGSCHQAPPPRPPPSNLLPCRARAPRIPLPACARQLRRARGHPPPPTPGPASAAAVLWFWLGATSVPRNQPLGEHHMKSRILRGAGITILVLLAAGVFWLANLIWFRPFNIDHFYDRVFLQYALKNPEMLSSLRILPSWADWYNDDLTDLSPAQDKAMLQLSKDALETLRSYDIDSQTPQQQLSTRILDWFLETTVNGERWLYHNYPV